MAVTDILTVIKVLHFMDGIKFLYFFSHLDFDWKLIHRKPSLTWPAKVYLANRFTGIACVVSMLVGLNVLSPINCEAWIVTSFLFPLLELELSLLLIVIRVVAIWQCSNLIIGLTAITLSVHSGIALHLLAGLRAFWDPGPFFKGCVVHAPRIHLLLMSIATIATYAILLFAMLAGLLRHRQSRSFGVWKMLCQQGWVWFALAVAAEVPTLTLVLLNINPALNLMFQVPRVVIASIGTTTMFRMLYNYSGQKDSEAGLPINIRQLKPDSSVMSASSGSSSPQLKVSVHTTTDQFIDETFLEEGL